MSVTYSAVRYVDGRPVAVDLPAVEMNLANGNAYALAAALGVAAPNDYYYGSFTLPEARRALMRALNVDTSPHLRPASDTKSPGRMRVITQGLDAERMEGYLARFDRLIQAAAAAGADRIEWA